MIDIGWVRFSKDFPEAGVYPNRHIIDGHFIFHLKENNIHFCIPLDSSRYPMNLLVSSLGDSKTNGNN